MSSSGIILTVFFLLLVASGGTLLAVSDFDHHPFRILFGVILLIAAAAIIARPLTAFLTGGTGGLFFPGQRNRKPPPAYSTAQARRMQGKYREALRLYDTIVREYPQEIAAWRSMIEIALENCGDLPLARSLLTTGLAALASDEHRRILQETFDEGSADAPVKRVSLK